MANWSNPQLTSTYTNFVTEVKDRDVDLARQFDGQTVSNLPTNAIRWNSSISRWQKWDGSAWIELASTYALTGLSTTGNASIGGTLSVTGNTSLATATATTPATGDNSTNLATTAWVRAQNYLTSGGGSFLPLTGGTISGNLTITGDLAVSDLNGGQIFGLKNKVINGDFLIDQYNNGATVTVNTNNAYVVDRWTINNFVAGPTITGGQNLNSITPPDFINSYVGVQNGSAVTVTSTMQARLRHQIEGYNVANWRWGATNGRDAMLSFWVRSSLTGTHAVAINNVGNTDSYVATYTISAANTWEYKSMKIPAPPNNGGVWFKADGVGIRLSFNLGAGSSFTTSIANQWVSGDFRATTSSVSLVANANATFYLTGVQLEDAEASNSVATVFEDNPYTVKLALCQRYYYAATQYVGTSSAVSTYTHPVPMRATPTRTGGGTGYTASLLNATGVAHYQTTAGSQAMTYSAEL